ncbi:MAG TPA: succinate dehydrogenase, cytochrome b556 subunit [Verrucomicrobiae bacterium]|nr:succinate dehydrogenase, cytochrome b556 subunit [Verrucomicrobiae bacterium]
MSSPAPQAKPLPARPLSPFMIGPYYRPQLTSMLSILHRITGVGLSVGAVLLVGWLLAIAGGAWTYASFAPHLGAWYGQLLLLGWTWSLLYHLCNGIRHLFWDLGHGYSIPVVYRSGYAAVAASLLLTVAVWGVAYAR